MMKNKIKIQWELKFCYYFIVFAVASTLDWYVELLMLAFASQTKQLTCIPVSIHNSTHTGKSSRSFPVGLVLLSAWREKKADLSSSGCKDVANQPGDS